MITDLAFQIQVCKAETMIGGVTISSAWSDIQLVKSDDDTDEVTVPNALRENVVEIFHLGVIAFDTSFRIGNLGVIFLLSISSFIKEFGKDAGFDSVTAVTDIRKTKTSLTVREFLKIIA